MAATECVGCKLRNTPGRCRKTSVIRPTLEGVLSRRKTPEDIVGIASVPSFPITASRASITVSAPPSTSAKRGERAMHQDNIAVFQSERAQIAGDLVFGNLHDEAPMSECGFSLSVERTPHPAAG